MKCARSGEAQLIQVNNNSAYDQRRGHQMTHLVLLIVYLGTRWRAVGACHQLSVIGEDIHVSAENAADSQIHFVSRHCSTVCGLSRYRGRVVHLSQCGAQQHQITRPALHKSKHSVYRYKLLRASQFLRSVLKFFFSFYVVVS